MKLLRCSLLLITPSVTFRESVKMLPSSPYSLCYIPWRCYDAHFFWGNSGGCVRLWWLWRWWWWRRPVSRASSSLVPRLEGWSWLSFDLLGREANHLPFLHAPIPINRRPLLSLTEYLTLHVWPIILPLQTLNALVNINYDVFAL